MNERKRKKRKQGMIWKEREEEKKQWIFESWREKY